MLCSIRKDTPVQTSIALQEKIGKVLNWVLGWTSPTVADVPRKCMRLANGSKKSCLGGA